MAIKLTCRCGKRLRTKEENAGRRAKCTSCQRSLVIPSRDPFIHPMRSAGRRRKTVAGANLPPFKFAEDSEHLATPAEARVSESTRCTYARCEGLMLLVGVLGITLWWFAAFDFKIRP